MTTIIALQKPDCVIIAADNQVTSTRKYRHPKMAKITKRGQYLIAGSGEVAACDIAQHIFVPPKPNLEDKKDLYHFMIAKFIPALKKCFKEQEYKWQPTVDDDEYETKFMFLVAICGEVFEIADDLAVTLDDSGIYGVGSGSDIAIGALHAGATLDKALKIAAKIDPFTSAPFIKMEQKKNG